MTIHMTNDTSRSSDRMLAEQVLSELKRVTAEYVTAATEASAADLRALFRALANQTLDAHERLLAAMREHGLIEAAFAAPQQEVQKQAQMSSEAHRATAQLLGELSARPLHEPMHWPLQPGTYQPAFQPIFQPLYESPYQPSPQWMRQNDWQDMPQQPIFYPPVPQMYPQQQRAPLMPEFAQPHAMPFEGRLPMNDAPQPLGMPMEAGLPEGFAGPGAFLGDRTDEPPPASQSAAAQHSVAPQPFAMPDVEADEDEAPAKKTAKRGGKRSKSTSGAAAE